MNESRRLNDASSPWTLHNAPVRPREWAALVATPGAVHVQDEGGELLLESKQDAKKRGIKSPDRADSLALTFAYPVKKQDEWDSHMAASHAVQWQALDEISGY